MKFFSRVRNWFHDVDICTSDITYLGDGVYQGGSILGLPSYIGADLNVHDGRRYDNSKPFCSMAITDNGDFPGVDWLQEAVDHIVFWRNAGRSVLVRCAAGVSRSSMVTVAYFMFINGWTRERALAYVKSKRPQIRPCQQYLDGLAAYEEQLMNQRLHSTR